MVELGPIFKEREPLKLQQFFSGIPAEVLTQVENLHLNVSSERCQEDIDQLLGRTVLLGGKRLRPLLTFLFGQYFGLTTDRVAPFASAIEMVHAASLAHDDVIDQAQTRRGRASINAESSNKRAVLAGDYLLADVIMSLTQKGSPQLVGEMASVIQQLSLGEWLQLDACEDRHYTAEVIEKIALYKTASVMSWCGVAPAILAELNEATVEKARAFGHHLGLAFQMIDDTLDFSGDSQKDQLLDLQNGIVNSVVYRWLESDTSLMQKFQKGEDLSSIVTTPLPKALESAIEDVKRQSQKHLEQCHQLLAQMQTDLSDRVDSKKLSSGRKSLEFILSYLAKRTH